MPPKSFELAFLPIFKAFITSQFSYFPLMWMFHSHNLDNKISRIHERAQRSAFTCSKLTIETLEKSVKYVQS